MSWTYSQTKGVLMHRDGFTVGFGYSGKGACKNDPCTQDHKNMGPIPRGKYRIHALVSNTPDHGPFVLVLVPDDANEMFGRSGFLIHGDSKEHPGEASEGCIILDRQCRENIWYDADHDLEVIV